MGSVGGGFIWGGWVQMGGGLGSDVGGGGEFRWGLGSGGGDMWV